MTVMRITMSLHSEIYSVMQGINELEKKIGWYKLVAKTYEPEMKQK